MCIDLFFQEPENGACFYIDTKTRESLENLNVFSGTPTKADRSVRVSKLDIIADINFEFSETALGYVNYASAAWDLEVVQRREARFLKSDVYERERSGTAFPEGGTSVNFG